MSDYVNVRREYLAHASMAGMPSNLRTKEKRDQVARNTASKNVDRLMPEAKPLYMELSEVAKNWASGKINESAALASYNDLTNKLWFVGFNAGLKFGNKNPTAMLATMERAGMNGDNRKFFRTILSEADAERLRKFESRMLTLRETGRKDVYRSAGSKAGMPSNIPIRHASMAGMPTNVARKMGFRQVTGPSTKYYSDKVNNLKAKADEANKKVEEVILEMMSVTGDISGGKIKYALSKAKSAIQKFTKEAIPLMVDAIKAEDAYYEAIEQRNKSVLKDFDDKKSEAERWMSNVKGKMQK